MPQLNPNPWLLYFLFTWLILLLLMPKILGFVNLNELNPQNTKTTNFTWTWPWQ
uniref:ATP synthase complex subunit 8 n=1 Tax=Amolops hongkongensis TaxID=109946 RepID=A0A4Y1K6I6_9NEOB|nr:ATP synthase F0 subunit 8 [Amolops hongkongensis]